MIARLGDLRLGILHLSECKMSSGVLPRRIQLLMNANTARCIISLISWVYFADSIVVSTGVAAETVEQDRFEKEVVASGCKDTVGMDMSADGRLVFIERTGGVKLVNLRDGHVTQLAKIPAAYLGEVGLVGVALDKSFSQTGWIYFSYCPESDHSKMRLSPFMIVGGKLDLASEKKLFDYAIDEPAAIRMGGGLVMDKNGDPYMGTGDNSLPVSDKELKLPAQK